MDGERETSTYAIRTPEGGAVEVKCPICGHDRFVDSGPQKIEERRGFRHVVVGVTQQGRMLSVPVRFKACARCGFIIQNLIIKGDEK